MSDAQIETLNTLIRLRKATEGKCYDPFEFERILSDYATLRLYDFFEISTDCAEREVAAAEVLVALAKFERSLG